MSIVTRIASLHGRQIFDSRGQPTVEVDVVLSGGARARASVPSGASTGRHEAHELRDDDPSAYAGRGVLKAIAHVGDEIAPALIGRNALDQAMVDMLMRDLDGSENLGRLGANAVLATSLAVCRASARAQAKPLYRYIASLASNDELSLPMPMVNILSGGAHAAGGMDIQDFLAVPIGAHDMGEALQMMLDVRRSADRVLSSRGLSTLLADEGGLSPGCHRATEALDLMVEAIGGAGFEPGRDVAIAVDIAATRLFSEGSYAWRKEGRRLTSDEVIATVQDWRRHFPIISVEDALHEDEWESWARLTATSGELQIVGDDLFATNVGRIARGIRERAANAVLIKLNQNGTLSGTLEAIACARRAGLATIISARSGETDDAFIADLAVGTGAGQIKIGSLRTAERMSKYNQLLRISEDVGGALGPMPASFLGAS